jgi:hypothetical protein
MFGSRSEKFPLVDIKTASGWRMIIGPCAVRLILRLVHLLVGGALIWFGSGLAKR